NIVAAGSISSSIYEYQQVQVGMGSQLFTKGGGGKLKSEFRIDSADPSAVEMDIEDPEAGHIQLFDVGDVLRLRGLGTSEPRDSGASYDAILPGLAWIGADQTEQTTVRDVWLEVVTAIDNTTYYTYEVTYAGGHRGVFRFQAGRAVANYGQDGDGGVEISADQDGAPWMKIFRLDLSGDTPATIPTVLTGRLDVLPFIATEQYGQAQGVNLDDSTAARFVASDQGLELFKVDLVANDGTADTVRISANGEVKFGSDVDAEETTWFDLDPSIDEGAYASLIIRARLQSSIIELPQGEIAVYTAADLFDEGYGDYWTARVNLYGFQVTGGLPDAYTTDSAGVHRFTDQGYEIRHNAEADIGTPSVYPIFRLTGTGAGNMASYVADTDQETGETTDFGSYDWTEWSYNDPIIKFLAMFAPDAVASGQLYSSQAQMEFGALNLETGEELRVFTIYGDEQGLSRMQVVA
ncbi:MAG: hypothetical protein KDE20_26150, partial [Caldilineaceae bacterium]|nr:hypothetical protein [Caldilineaceae bacterium]